MPRTTWASDLTRHRFEEWNLDSCQQDVAQL